MSLSKAARDYGTLLPLQPKMKKITHITRNRRNMNFAIPADAAAIPPKPRTAAISAMMRKVTAQPNMFSPPCLQTNRIDHSRWPCWALIRADELRQTKEMECTVPQQKETQRRWTKLFSAAVRALYTREDPPPCAKRVHITDRARSLPRADLPNVTDQTRPIRRFDPGPVQHTCDQSGSCRIPADSCE